jgi:IS1 family transposase
MTNWLPFPPQTQEVQLDEKWSFVGKKERQCDPDEPADAQQGDNWDHVALDPEHRLVLSVVPGKRTAEAVATLVQEVQQRTEFRPLRLITSDEYPAYATALVDAYGEEHTPLRTGRPGRPVTATVVPSDDLVYATVHKTRENGRVVAVAEHRVFGTERALAQALEASTASTAVNTAFVERQHGTDRHRNARKGRKTYRFSKDWEVHNAMTFFTLYSYNFCWPVRTLRCKSSNGAWQPRTPAMAAGLADHVWPLAEWLTLPAIQLK